MFRPNQISPSRKAPALSLPRRSLSASPPLALRSFSTNMNPVKSAPKATSANRFALALLLAPLAILALAVVGLGQQQQDQSQSQAQAKQQVPHRSTRQKSSKSESAEKKE